MKKQVDIIIPVHNRPEHTRQTLESLLKNTNPDLYTLYIINDGCDQETNQVINEVLMNQNPPAIGFTHQEPVGPAASRNEVCKWITEHGDRSQYLYHSDNDVYFKEGWLETLIRVYEEMDEKGANIKLLGGGCHPYLQNNSRFSYDPFKGDVGAVGTKDAVSGYSQLMSWETWDKYGPFEEGQGSQEIKIMGSEDWAFCQRIIKDGFLVGAIEPEMVVHCGKTNTYGTPATGSETFKNLDGVMVK
jgi:glycosyltransferase involved in cell wall biosynthesis